MPKAPLTLEGAGPYNRAASGISSCGPLLFLRSFLSNPLKMGALAPSSPKLSRLMASCVDPGTAPVLEIGAGTGVITRALLQRGVSPERLFVIEQDPFLAAFLQREFPNVCVRQGEALDTRYILAEEVVGRVRTIISSLPLRNLPRTDQLETVRAMMDALAQGGQLIQFTYAAGCPIPNQRLGLTAECLGRVWVNFPPAAVWRFTRNSAIV